MNTHTIFQHTLKQQVSFVGLGLHSGIKSRVTLKPCNDATGMGHCTSRLSVIFTDNNIIRLVRILSPDELIWLSGSDQPQKF